ncbi:MAG: tetratricopeptide repeat protein [Xanthomonadales bacterium]|jgi:tetratricopeptide (TPR) repeat protein|nr:tetratricopeptide repeat protein [Xanthomonadales bacterium]
MTAKTNSLLPVIAAVLLLFSGSTVAQAGKCGEQRNVMVKALDELTWKQLNAIYEDVGEEKYDEAYEDLLKMVRRAGKNEYLQAVMYQALAQVEWSRKNYDESLKYFETAVELDTLPDQTHFALMYQIAQLYFMKDRYQDSLDALDLWFCKVPAESVTSHAYVLKASINVQKEDYREALRAIDTAIGMEDDPKENWYQLKLAAHFELQQFAEAASTLEIMITRWPDKKSYWLQLAQIYYQLGQEDRSLAVMAMAYRKNLLDKQSDIAYLSSLYSNANVPYKAAEVLEKGIRDGVVEPSKSHWTMVAETWYGAEELQKSLVAFREAGKAAEDGDIDLRRGFILVDLEDWQRALDALDEALRKGGLNDRRTGEAYLLRGMAQFNLQNFDAASADWGRAERYEGTRDAARQWMNHLREERLRRAS